MDSSIEKRFREVEDSVKAIANFVKEQTDKNKNMIEELKRSIKPPKIDIEKYEDRIESIEKEIENIKESAPTDIEQIQSAIDNFDERLSKIDNKLSTFATKDDLESFNKILPEEIDEKIETEINEKLERQGRKVLSDFENKINTLKIEFERDIETEVEKSLGDESRILRNEFNKKLNDLKTRFESSKDYGRIRDDLNRVNFRISDIENKLRRPTDEGYAAIRTSIDKRIQNLEKEITSLKTAESAEEKVDIGGIDNRIAQLKNKLDTFATKGELENLKSAIREEAVSDKILRELELLKSTDEEQSTVHKSIEKRMRDIEKEISSLKIAGSAEEVPDIKEVKEKIAQLNNLLEEERTKRSSILKNVQELEDEVDSLRKEKAKALVSKDIEDKLNKIVSKHLGEFAKAMDKRLPSIVTREEYLSFIRDVDKRLQNVVAPDLSHLLRRIEMLENQINEINTIARDMYNRIPVVVE